MSTTYAQLLIDIPANTENDGAEFTASLGLFIRNAEARLSRELDVPALSKHQTSAFSIGDPFLTKPATNVTLRHLTVVDAAGERHRLEQRTQEFINTFWPNRNLTDLPRYYAEWDETDVIVAPTPSAAFAVEAAYKIRIAGLSTTNESNFYAKNYEDLLFYACMREAEAFDKNWSTPALKAWEGMYVKALSTAVPDAGEFYTDETQTGATAA